MSNIHSPASQVLVAMSFDAVLANNTQNGAAVDCLGYTRGLLLFNTWTGASTTSDFTIEESDSGTGSWSAVTQTTDPAAVIASTADGGTVIVEIDLTKRKRYLRANSVSTGTAGNACLNFLLFNPSDQAVTQATTVVKA